MNSFTEGLQYIFKTSDEHVAIDFSKAIQVIPLPNETMEACERFSADEFKYIKDLGGENGSARLLKGSKTGDLVVLKTYEAFGDPLTGEVIDHSDRLDQLRHEGAAFLISSVLPLVKVPPTILRVLPPSTLKSWGIPLGYHSDMPMNFQAVMLQQYISNVTELSSIRQSLPDITTPETVFGLLLFDYLIANQEGRSRNLLVQGETLLAIDHGKSFGLPTGIRNTEGLGIPDGYTLESTESLSKMFNNESAQTLAPALQILLGKNKTNAFMVRFDKLRTILSAHVTLTVGELKSAIIAH